VAWENSVRSQSSSNMLLLGAFAFAAAAIGNEPPEDNCCDWGGGSTAEADPEERGGGRDNAGANGAGGWEKETVAPAWGRGPCGLARGGASSPSPVLTKTPRGGA